MDEIITNSIQEFNLKIEKEIESLVIYWGYQIKDLALVTVNYGFEPPPDIRDKCIREFVLTVKSCGMHDRVVYRQFLMNKSDLSE